MQTITINGSRVEETLITATELRLLKPSGTQVIRWMADHRDIRGIGTVKAQTLWDALGEDLYVSDRQGERSEAGRPPVGVGRGRAAAVAKGPEVPQPRRPYASASDTPSSHSRRGHGEARQRAAGRVPCRCRDPGAGRTGA